MNGKERPKMTPAERAKQFMPFAALKGYEEALRKTEERIEAENAAKIKREKEPEINSGAADIP